jgi:hypothetical protein
MEVILTYFEVGYRVPTFACREWGKPEIIRFREWNWIPRPPEHEAGVMTAGWWVEESGPQIIEDEDHHCQPVPECNLAIGYVFFCILVAVWKHFPEFCKEWVIPVEDNWSHWILNSDLAECTPSGMSLPKVIELGNYTYNCYSSYRSSWSASKPWWICVCPYAYFRSWNQIHC